MQLHFFINSLPFYSFFFFKLYPDVSQVQCHCSRVITLSGGVITQQMTMDDWPLRRMSCAFSAAFALRVCRSARDAACASKEKTLSWIIHPILRGKGGGEWGEKPLSVLEMTYQEDDVMPREGCRWCHLLIWYAIVKLLVWLFNHNLFFSHFFSLTDKENVILNPEIRSVD